MKISLVDSTTNKIITPYRENGFGVPQPGSIIRSPDLSKKYEVVWVEYVSSPPADNGLGDPNSWYCWEALIFVRNETMGGGIPL